MENIKVIFIDIDNTLLDFDEYVKETMKNGFKHFSLKEYQPYMYDIFTQENNKLWLQIEKGELTFQELEMYDSQIHISLDFRTHQIHPFITF